MIDEEIEVEVGACARPSKQRVQSKVWACAVVERNDKLSSAQEEIV